MTVKYRNSIVPLALAEWTVKNGNISEGIVTLNKNGMLVYSKTFKTEEDKIIGDSYKIRVKYKSPIVIDLYNPKVQMELVFTKVDSIVIHSTLNVDPTNLVGDYTEFNIKLPSGTVDKMSVSLMNKQDTAIKIENVEIFPSYDISEFTESVLESKLPSYIEVLNHETVTITPNLKKIHSLPFGLSSQSATKVNVVGELYSNKDDILEIQIHCNSDVIKPFPMRQRLFQGYNTISYTVGTENTVNGNNQIDLLLGTTDGFSSINKEKLLMFIEAKNILSSSMGSVSNLYYQASILELIFKDLVTANDITKYKNKVYEFVTHINELQTNINTNYQIEFY